MQGSPHSLADAVLAAHACEEARGVDTVVLDLRKITPVFDFFVISTARNPRQMRGLAERAHQALKTRGSQRISYEGIDGGIWVVSDYGDVLIHIFNQDSRSLYDLEHLWGDAPQLDWKALPYNEDVLAATRVK